MLSFNFGVKQCTEKKISLKNTKRSHQSCFRSTNRAVLKNDVEKMAQFCRSSNDSQSQRYIRAICIFAR